MSFSMGIDYLSFTVKGVPLKEVLEQLGGDFVQSEKGFRGYPVAYIGSGEAGGTAIVGTGAPRNKTEVHADIPAGFLSGWSFERIQALAKWVRAKGGHLTRLDTALDDRTGVVTVAQVQRALAKGQAVTRFREMTRLHKMGLERKTDHQGDTVNVGSRQSQTFLRVYDKALEQQSKGHTVEGPWVRWELEFKQERAEKCGQELASLDAEEYRRFIVGVLRSAIDFRATDWGAEPMVRCRARPLRWWIQLTNGFAKARLVLDPVVRKIEDVKQWVADTLGPMLAVICASKAAGQSWLEQVIVAGAERWKAKHYALLQKQAPMTPYILKA
jgi:DNA relaxase NicK